MVAESRKAKALAEMGIDKPLEPPRNGILVPELIPVAHTVLENWKVLIKGLSQLLTVVSVYGCRYGFWHQYEPSNDVLTVGGISMYWPVGESKKQYQSRQLLLKCLVAYTDTLREYN